MLPGTEAVLGFREAIGSASFRGLFVYYRLLTSF